LTTAGFARMVERAGEAAGLDFKAHPHMLRHASAGLLALVNKGRDARPAGLSRAQEHPAHGSLHRAGARSVQGFLEALDCIKRSCASRIFRSSRLRRREMIARTP
jgi:hypothetical protein